jgi:hypothetical protein
MGKNEGGRKFYKDRLTKFEKVKISAVSKCKGGNKNVR